MKNELFPKSPGYFKAGFARAPPKVGPKIEPLHLVRVASKTHLNMIEQMYHSHGPNQRQDAKCPRL